MVISLSSVLITLDGDSIKLITFASKIGGYENENLIHTHTMNAKMKAHDVCVCDVLNHFENESS